MALRFDVGFNEREFKKLQAAALAFPKTFITNMDMALEATAQNIRNEMTDILDTGSETGWTGVDEGDLKNNLTIAKGPMSRQVGAPSKFKHATAVETGSGVHHSPATDAQALGARDFPMASGDTIKPTRKTFLRFKIDKRKGRRSLPHYPKGNARTFYAKDKQGRESLTLEQVQTMDEFWVWTTEMQGMAPRHYASGATRRSIRFFQRMALQAGIRTVQELGGKP